MDNLIRYKYLVIYDRSRKIIYGERIEWLCGKFDKLDDVDFTVGLKSGYRARIITSSEIIESIEDRAIKIDKLNFNYTHSSDDFITQCNEEELFTPLIDRCSNIKSYLDDDISYENIESFTGDNKELIQEIENRFSIDFNKKPELYGTFTLYNPTRIIVDSYFLDSKEKKPIDICVTFHDEFNKYDGSLYKINQYIADELVHTTTGSINEKSVTPSSEQDFDELEVVIEREGEVIFHSKYGFIRSISINANFVSGSVLQPNGTKVDKVSRYSFDIGKDDV
ncbi:hypothetical protein AB6C45_16220 [Vibrio splendidus]